MLVHENAVAWLYFYPETAILEVEWIDRPDGPLFRNTLLTALELTRIHGARHWLHNLLQLRTLHPADLHWAVNEALPALYRQGIDRVVAVEPISPQLRTLIDTLAPPAKALLGYGHGAFPDRAAAWAWLHNYAPPSSTLSASQ